MTATGHSSARVLTLCFSLATVLADRELIGAERMAKVIADKGHYTWICKTVLDDEPRMASMVKANGLAVR
jgi:hypothetical protein